MATLLQPAVIISWGAHSLKRLFFNATMNFRSENQGHDLTFSFEPSLRGYELYRKCVAEDNREKPIVVTMGYSNGNSITGEFQYTGAEVLTGNTQSVTVSAHSFAIGKLNKFKLNKTYGDGTSILPLADILKQESRYRGLVLNTTELEPVSVVHSTMSGETTGQFIKRELRSLGYTISLPVSPGIAGVDAVVDKPFVSGQRIVSNGERVSEIDRKAYFISLELLTEFSKSVKYNPPALTDNLSGTSDSNQPTLEEDSIIDNVAPTSGTVDDESGITDSDEKVIDSNKTANNSDVSSLDNSGVAADPTTLTNSKDEITRQASTSVYMVPRICGIRPKDFILVPSLKGDYAEDWEVTDVTYSQSGGAITLELQLKRWSKDEPMLTNIGELLKKINAVKDWHDYYWLPT